MKIISTRGRLKSGVVTISRDQAIELDNCRANPTYFISNYIKYCDPALGAQVLNLRSHQYEYVNHLQKETNTVNMLARQTGSTIVSLAFILWEALFHPDQRIQVQGINVHATRHMIDTLAYMIDHLPAFMKSLVVSTTKTHLHFSNDSRIHTCVSSATCLRGMSLTRLYLDCFAFTAGSTQQAIAMDFMAMIARGCKVTITSVPNGPSNTFATIWADANKNLISYFTAFKRTVDDVGYSVLWKQKTKAHLGDQAYAQEYLCEFV